MHRMAHSDILKLSTARCYHLCGGPEGIDRSLGFDYDDLSRLTSITHQDGSVTTYAYNTLGLLERITNIDGLTLT